MFSLISIVKQEMFLEIITDYIGKFFPKANFMMLCGLNFTTFLFA